MDWELGGKSTILTCYVGMKTIDDDGQSFCMKNYHFPSTRRPITYIYVIVNDSKQHALMTSIPILVIKLLQMCQTSCNIISFISTSNRISCKWDA